MPRAYTYIYSSTPRGFTLIIQRPTDVTYANGTLRLRQRTLSRVELSPTDKEYPEVFRARTDHPCITHVSRAVPRTLKFPHIPHTFELFPASEPTTLVRGRMQYTGNPTRTTQSTIGLRGIPEGVFEQSLSIVARLSPQLD